ncbi:MAG: pspA [Novosphingobium lindaniclasticum]|uniref:phage shock protein PspA n=1 Tax=Novosphingobium lindaniclasticum TaxID=1329895 RepID=UPI002409CB83|nr:phage shock protein PspA [Novosphingobium lindaniclasticum]MDF2637361.1 pspA [Novosphingobium lindaniclasticum]
MSRLDAEIEILQTSAQDAPPFQAAPAFQTGRPRPFNPGSGEGTFRFSQARKFNPTSIKGNARMGIFSRTRDIIAANFNDMLDKAEDPGKMIRLIILEMEETLVEVRTSSARTIADQKELRRHVGKLNQLQHDWGDKAQLALSKDREDLARAALLEKKKAGDMAEQLGAEIAVLDDALRAYEEDIEKLQNRLREARSRQSSIAARLQSAENRVKLRTLLSSERVDEALVRFDQLERRVDYAEGRAEAMSLGDSRQPTLAEEIAALQDGDTIDAELAEMKRAMNTGKPASE